MNWNIMYRSVALKSVRLLLGPGPKLRPSITTLPNPVGLPPAGAPQSIGGRCKYYGRERIRLKLKLSSVGSLLRMERNPTKRERAGKSARNIFSTEDSPGAVGTGESKPPGIVEADVGVDGSGIDNAGLCRPSRHP